MHVSAQLTFSFFMQSEISAHDGHVFLPPPKQGNPHRVQRPLSQMVVGIIRLTTQKYYQQAEGSEVHSHPQTLREYISMSSL